MAVRRIQGMAKIVPDNLFAFPPSMAVIVRGVSICPWMDGSRVTQEQLPRSGSFTYRDGKDCSRQSLCISTIHGGHR